MHFHALHLFMPLRPRPTSPRHRFAEGFASERKPRTGRHCKVWRLYLNWKREGRQHYFEKQTSVWRGTDNRLYQDITKELLPSGQLYLVVYKTADAATGQYAHHRSPSVPLPAPYLGLPANLHLARSNICAIQHQQRQREDCTMFTRLMLLNISLQTRRHSVNSELCRTAAWQTRCAWRV